ncbi:unnamed protein product [Brassicogethes aeneus]|uniref:Uncharacterized protein n=1 Tax=Brassicogethes aeneus TaxID=1431903 RepID=A0A9P0ASW2_BRAAE|nr:unnamed protein product [Brassicogethes aeneus]
MSSSDDSVQNAVVLYDKLGPKPLQLTAGKEALLIENEEVFRKNGFIFVIDKNELNKLKKTELIEILTLKKVPASSVSNDIVTNFVKELFSTETESEPESTVTCEKNSY